MINVVPTYDDIIEFDSVCCPTFQLVWNDFVKFFDGSIYFDDNINFIRNLNKKLFNDSMISDDYYFKIYGLKNLDLKLRIEKGIYDKFGQKSDVLDDIDFKSSNNSYLFYTMLYRKFRYDKCFKIFENENFGLKENIKFFGFDDSQIYKNQVDILFYNQNSYGIKIKALNDEVILYKNPLGNTFNEIYSNLRDLEKNYTGQKELVDGDKLRIPFISFNVKKEYSEIENLVLRTYDNRRIIIEKALQTIKLFLDEEGGEVKSESVIGVKILSFDYHKMRRFYFDDTFAMFIKEKDKITPYFSVLINDISKFQEN